MPGEAIIQQVKNVLTRELTITSATGTSSTSASTLLTGPTSGNLIGWSVFMSWDTVGQNEIVVRLNGNEIAGYGARIDDEGKHETIWLPGNGLEITSSSNIFLTSVSGNVDFVVSLFTI